MNILPIVSQNGPLPIKTTFNAPLDGPAVFALSGTVWSNAADTSIGFNVELDGAPIAKCVVYANPSSTHMAVPAQFVQVSLTFGQHTLVVVPATGQTQSDYNDFFYVTLLY